VRYIPDILSGFRFSLIWIPEVSASPVHIAKVPEVSKIFLAVPELDGCQEFDVG
jgi:hypothetical protein